MAVKYKDYYEILGVPRTASKEEINKKYRKLARQYHPDVNKSGGAEDKLKEINEAYQVLKDPEKRKKYDQLGADWQAGQDFTPPPGWNVHVGGAGGPRGGQGAQEFDFGGFGGGGFSDFFDAIFGRAGRGGGGGRTQPGGFDFGGFPGGAGPGTAARGAPAKGQNLESEIAISLEDAYHGATRDIAFQVAGESPHAPSATRKRSYSVKIPPGIQDGGKIRLAGQGAPSPNGQPGDLILTVRIAKHPVYRQKGSDLEVDLKVAPWEAALGARTPVPTLDGPVTLTLPAGASSGQKMRLAGKGMRKKGGGRGDQYAIVKIMTPKKLSAEEKNLFEQLRDKSSFNPR